MNPNIWDEDREEILQHWKNLGRFHRVLLLVLLLFPQVLPSFFYLLNRSAIRPDRMVKIKELHWETIPKFLRYNIFK